MNRLFNVGVWKAKRISHTTESVLDGMYWSNLCLKSVFGKDEVGSEVHWMFLDVYTFQDRDNTHIAFVGRIAGGEKYWEAGGKYWDVVLKFELVEAFRSNKKQQKAWVLSPTGHVDLEYATAKEGDHSKRSTAARSLMELEKFYLKDSK